MGIDREKEREKWNENIRNGWMENMVRKVPGGDFSNQREEMESRESSERNVYTNCPVPNDRHDKEYVSRID
jgi:hypothetical protein